MFLAISRLRGVNVSGYLQVEAHSALLCFKFSVVAFKDGGAVEAGVITRPASGTLFMVYQYGTILFLFIDNFIGATINTGEFL
jgi:hypothetical protein